MSTYFQRLTRITNLPKEEELKFLETICPTELSESTLENEINSWLHKKETDRTLVECRNRLLKTLEMENVPPFGPINIPYRGNNYAYPLGAFFEGIKMNTRREQDYVFTISSSEEIKSIFPTQISIQWNSDNVFDYQLMEKKNCIMIKSTTPWIVLCAMIDPPPQRISVTVEIYQTQ